MSKDAESKLARREPKRDPGRKREEHWLWVEGYKAIRERMRLKIAPLTIIAGVNSSGKSSFLQPFLMMKQTLDSVFDPGPLLIHGPNVRITDHLQMFSRGKSRSDVVDSFVAGMSIGDDYCSVKFAVRDQQIVLESQQVRSQGREISLSEHLTEKRKERLRAEFSETAMSYTRYFRNPDGSAEVEWDIDVTRNRCFLEPVVVLKTGSHRVGLPFGERYFDDEQWVRLLQGIIHVPGLRGNPERAYSRSAVGSTHPGTFETYVASVVLEWSIRNDKRLATLSSQLEALGLTWKLAARKLDDASIELNVGRMPHAQQGGAHDLVNVADVGFGVSQTLPVLVALLTAREGQIVYIEQPEIHLHPQAQVSLASALVTAASRGVYVIAETHSSLLIRGIQTAVANGEIDPIELSLNWFGRDRLTGFQSIMTAEVDSVGRFGDWPLDFDDVARDADWAYLEALERREEGMRS